MKTPPFHRVAILEPSLVYALPLAAGNTVPWRDETATWLAGARRNGADAVYARLQGGTRAELEVVKWLSGQAEMRVLAPGWMAGECGDGFGLHFRGAEGEALKRAKAKAAPGTLIGQSCHSLEEALDAQYNGADYIFISPVFPTQTHPKAMPLGLPKLAEICAAVDIPVYGLGGINAKNAPDVLKAGASGIAGIRMFL